MCILKGWGIGKRGLGNYMVRVWSLKTLKICRDDRGFRV